MLVARLKKWLKEKKGIAIDQLGIWIITLAILVLVVVGFIILRVKGISAIEFIKKLLGF